MEYPRPIESIEVKTWYGTILRRFTPNQFDEALDYYFSHDDSELQDMHFSAYDKDGNDMGIIY